MSRLVLNPFTQKLDYTYSPNAAGPVQTLTGNSGGAVPPNPSATIFILGDAVTGLTTTGVIADNTITIISSPITVTSGANITATASWVLGSAASIALSGTTNHAVQVGNGSGSLTSLSVGATGTVLTGNTGADPSFQALSGIAVTSITGTANQIAASSSTGAVTLSLIGPYTPATYTNHGVLIGASTSSITATATGSAGQLLTSGGASANPTWTTVTYPANAQQGDLIYASADFVFSLLNKSTSPTRYLANTGTNNGPAWSLVDLVTGVTNTLPLISGGTGSALTASIGGIVYSNASALLMLAGSPANGNILRSGSSGGSGVPSWSTAVYPASTTANNLLYSNATDNITSLATANNGVLITSSGGVPSISSTLPNAVQDNITRLGTIASIGAPLGVSFGGTGVSSVTVAPAATAFAGWDSNKNFSANSFIPGYTTTATGGTTTTLTVASSGQQFFTGSTTQTVLLPVVSTLVLGQRYFIANNSSGVVTVQSSGGNTVLAMPANSSATFTVIAVTGTTDTSWSATSGVVSIAGTANQITASASTGAVTLSTPSTFIAPGSIAATTSISASSGTSSILGTVNINNSGTGATTIGNTTGGTSFAGEVIITGTNSSTSTTLLVTGTQTTDSAGTGAGNTFGIISNNTFNSTLGANLAAAVYVTPVFQSPSTKTVTTAAGVYISPTFSISGTITSAYSLYAAAPPVSANLTNRYTAYFDAGVGIGAANAAGATNALLVTGALGCTTALNACSSSGIATIGSSTALTISAAGLLSAANTTDTSSGSTGSINTLGGIGATKSVYCGGNLLLPTSTTSVGTIQINGASYFHNGGISTSVFMGPSCGNYTSSGTNSIAIGNTALAGVTSATDSIAIGRAAGKNTSTGIENVYIGVGAGQFNSTGTKNTAVGSYALDGVTGNNNSDNTAVGWGSLTAITTGSDNTAVGISTGAALTTGQFNCLFGNGTGAALTTGGTNLLFGSGAGSAITTGSTNIIVGDHPGSTTLGSTIFIGYSGSGTAVFNSGCFVDGIQQNTTTGAAVLVNASGKLAPVSSARRFKNNICDMGDISSAIYDLKPRCFTYINPDDDQTLQGGLIAEEVEETALKDMLVMYQADGQTQSVHYYKLPVLLLNEMQKLLRRIEVLEGNS